MLLSKTAQFFHFLAFITATIISHHQLTSNQLKTGPQLIMSCRNSENLVKYVATIPRTL